MIPGSCPGPVNLFSRFFRTSRNRGYFSLHCLKVFEKLYDTGTPVDRLNATFCEKILGFMSRFIQFFFAIFHIKMYVGSVKASYLKKERG